MGIERLLKINSEWMTSIERIRKRSGVTEDLSAGKVCIHRRFLEVDCIESAPGSVSATPETGPVGALPIQH
jgi:hypothetical protein